MIACVAVSMNTIELAIWLVTMYCVPSAVNAPSKGTPSVWIGPRESHVFVAGSNTRMSPRLAPFGPQVETQIGPSLGDCSRTNGPTAGEAGKNPPVRIG